MSEYKHLKIRVQSLTCDALEEFSVAAKTDQILTSQQYSKYSKKNYFI